MLSRDKGTGKKSVRADLSVGLAGDHGGFELKEKLKKILTRKKYRVFDFGTYNQESCDYPEFGIKLIKAVLAKKVRRGVLVCRSGIGFSILANRFKGIRATLCYNVKAAQRSRAHNDSNVLILGGDFVSQKEANKILDVWLNTEFEGGRHLRRLKQIEKFSKNL